MPADQQPEDAPETDEQVTEPVDEPDKEPSDSEEEVPPSDRPSSRQFEVICREALGLEPASSGGPSHRVSQLTLHHTAVELADSSAAPQRLRSHQAYHQDQGWVDIAYHFGVDPNGNLYELRDPEVAGETFTEYDPAGHFLVVCEGNYDVASPTDAMLQATAEILAYGALRFGISPDTLTGHRDHASITCPGDYLYARLDELRQEVARLVDGGVEHTSLCGDVGRQRIAIIEAG